MTQSVLYYRYKNKILINLIFKDKTNANSTNLYIPFN